MPPALVKTPPAYTESGIAPKCGTLTSASTRPLSPGAPRWSQPPGPVADAAAAVESETTTESQSATHVDRAILAASHRPTLLALE